MGQDGALDARRQAVPVQIVAVHGDIDHAGEGLRAAKFREVGGEPSGDFDAARGDADERDFGEVGIALDDLVRDALETALDGRAVEERARRREWAGWDAWDSCSLATSQDRFKGTAAS